MKENFYFLLFIGVLLGLSTMGQKTVVVVQPDAGLNIGALNIAVKTASNPGNTIFELKRGGLYLLNGAISHTGYTLHIRAQAGTGARPVLQPAVDALGASSNHFNPSANIILEGLFIQGKDELGAIANRQIIVSGNGNRIIFNDCYFDYSNQAFLRLTSSNNKVYIRNSILRNSIRPEAPDNGRIVDCRENPQDTLLIENSTIYNYSANIFSQLGYVKYMKLDHITFFQSAFRYNVDLGKALKAVVTNNIFYNFALSGNPHSNDAMFSVDSMYTVGEYKDANRFFWLCNNNFYSQKEFGDILDQYCPNMLYRFAPADVAHKDTIRYKYSLRTNIFVNHAIIDTITVSKLPVMWKFIKAGQVDTTNVFSEKLTFKNAPPLNLEYWKFFVEHGFSIGSLTPPNAYADEDKSILGEVTTGSYDFGYNTGSKSAKAANGGLPLGDPRWVTFTPVSANAIEINSNSTKTYPNPFSDNVTFGIESTEYTSARIVIFDLLGNEICNRQVQVMKGFNPVQVDLSNIINPGIYLYQVRIGQSGNAMVVSNGKLIKK